MCGIVGVINNKKAVPFILSGLKTLEYRGYDSCGVYIYNQGVYKSLKRIEDLKDKVKHLNSTLAIGHTRWATHGNVSLSNAHPHISKNGYINLVHNGVIHNYLELKEELLDKGYSFYGDTDSEVLANYIEYVYLKENDINKTLEIISNTIIGELAIAFIIKDINTLFYLKRKSPLVLAKRNNSYALASDIIALNKYDYNYYPCDNEYGYLNSKEQVSYKNGIKNKIVFNKENNSLLIPTKGHFKHFMKKEIFEEPNVIDRLKDKYLNLELIKKINKEIENKNVSILGCGTSYNAAKYVESRIKSRKVKAYIASEYEYNEEDDYFIFVSQSGETYDLIKTIDKLPKDKIKILITNNIHSSLARKANYVFSMEAGFEVAVAATKSYISSIIILLMIFKYEIFNKNYFEDIKQNIEEVLLKEKEVKNIGKKIKDKRSLYYVSKYEGYDLMKEGALKIKEISYIHAESIHGGELKHGPIATLDSSFAAIFLKSLNDKDIDANVLEVKARNIDTILIGFDKECDIQFKKGPMYLEYIGPIVFLQLLSYETAKLLKRDIDKPRNLAKSVTVI